MKPEESIEAACAAIAKAVNEDPSVLRNFRKPLKGSDLRELLKTNFIVMKKCIGIFIIILAFEAMCAICIFADKRDMEQFGFWNQWLMLHVPLVIFFTIAGAFFFGIKLI